MRPSNSEPDLLNFDAWITYGLRRGWIGPPICISHEGLPISNEEFEDNDRCAMMIRIYDTPIQQADVERSHLPSINNRGIYL
jgi:hypothetical protein